MDRDPIERLLDFWFGPLGEDGVFDKAHRQLWFAPNEEFDRRCRDDFDTPTPEELAFLAGPEAPF